jgi:hypothetical protein
VERNIFVQKKDFMTHKLLLCLAIFCLGCAGFVKGQKVKDYSSYLDHTPGFLQKDSASADSLFKNDVMVLEQLWHFDSIDAALLKKPVLSVMLRDQVAMGKPATYRTIIESITNFKRTEAYQDFITGIILYRKLAAMPVNLQNWDTDKILFARMGFTESDLDDFEKFLRKPEQANMTYKQAYMGYMKELDGLDTINHL